MTPVSTPPATPRVVAIEWSGRLAGERRTIWLAEAAGGRLLRLESGRSRDEVAEHLIELGRPDITLVVGLDFAFSMPAWFMREQGFSGSHELWAAAPEATERWLERCEPPFWGRPGRKRPHSPDPFRATDLEVPSVRGIRPKSVFQVGGAGAVGTGSLRGFPLLNRLEEAGFSIWPFDEPRSPLVIEIYPRVLTRAVTKSNPAERARYLTAYAGTLTREQLERATESEDALDAAVSALVMMQNLDRILALERTEDPLKQLEGEIWIPSPMRPEPRMVKRRDAAP